MNKSTLIPRNHILSFWWSLYTDVYIYLLYKNLCITNCPGENPNNKTWLHTVERLKGIAFLSTKLGVIWKLWNNTWNIYIWTNPTWFSWLVVGFLPCFFTDRLVTPSIWWLVGSEEVANFHFCCYRQHFLGMVTPSLPSNFQPVGTFKIYLKNRTL